MNGVERGGLKGCGGPERKNHVPLSLHEEHGRSLGAKGGHDAGDMRMKDNEYLSHLSLLVRHGPQLMVFLARFAGALTRSVLEEASTEAGDRGRVLVEGASEGGRPSEISLGERPDMFEDDGDGGISGAGRRDGEGECRRGRLTSVGGSPCNGKLKWIVSIVYHALQSRLQRRVSLLFISKITISRLSGTFQINNS
jgi:hypothetical protein